MIDKLLPSLSHGCVDFARVERVLRLFAGHTKTDATNTCTNQTRCGLWKPRLREALRITARSWLRARDVSAPTQD